MQTFKSALAIGLATLLLSTSLATAGNNPIDIGQIGDGKGPVLRIDNNDNGGIQTLPRPTGPVTTPDNPHVDPGNNKPAPEFGNDGVVADGPVLKLSPYQVSCVVWPHAFKNGAAEIWFKNTGTETIPAGSIITVTYPDGSKEFLKVDEDIKPGASAGIMGPAMANDEGFTCSAKVKAPKSGPADPKLGN